MNTKSVYILFIVLFLFSTMLIARSEIAEESQESVTAEPQRVYHPDSLRQVIVHNAGQLNFPAVDAYLSTAYVSNPIDPETGQTAYSTTYPGNTLKTHIYTGMLWVGGIVNGDTLVSTANDGWAIHAEEFVAAIPDKGGSYRTGNYANDEFTTTVYDTLTVDGNFEFPHTPLNLEVNYNSYSWKDTLYDDFVIMSYTMTNIGSEYISDSWIGFYLDNDIAIYRNWIGAADDLSGYVDTLLADGIPSSRALIGYSCDNDGDPAINGSHVWGEESIRSSISLSLLDCNLDTYQTNFNWWISNGQTHLDYGPRQLGTTVDPLRLFDSGNLGTPMTDEDKYYILSHPERDFDQIETAIHDSTDGWILPNSESQILDFADGFDTRFLYSFGGFDLAPGESVEFTFALVGADNLHVNPSDFEDLFDVENPSVYQNALDFSSMILHHQRAYEVYQSGLTLPHPGPPVGLEIADFDDAFIDLIWNASTRPDLAGYNVYYRTMGDWELANISPVTDSVHSLAITDPLQIHEIAISIVDNIGRESTLSESIQIIPAAPKRVENPAIELVDKYPYVTWDAHPDTLVDEYIIYRSIWKDPFEKYDSTSSINFFDYGVDRGKKYSYKIAAKNVLNVESALSDSVFTIPMDLDGSVLFLNISYQTHGLPIYNHESFLELYNSVADQLGANLHTTNFTMDGPISFYDLSHYSTVVVVCESREANLLLSNNGTTVDSIANYLQFGGNVLFLTLNASLDHTPRDVIDRFQPGDMQYDILKLDSSVSRRVIVGDGHLLGDLAGCESQNSEYIPLDTDTTLFTWIYDPPYIPACGWMFPREGFVDTLYRYVSINPDTAHHGNINGIRYLGDNYKFILLNFPLSLMNGPANEYVLKQALEDFGFQFNCGDANNDQSINVGDVITMLNYIFYCIPLPNEFWYSDVNCDEKINLADVVTMVNYVFRNKAPLNCCQIN